MSVESNPCRNDYVGNGITAIFDYDFKIDENTDLLVVTLDSTFTEVELSLGTDYTVSDVGESDGGQITLSVALALNKRLSILRRAPEEQQNNIGNQGTFYPEVVEDSLDSLTRLVQQLQEQVYRAIKMPDSVPNSLFNPNLSSDILDPENAGKSISINEDNDGFEIGGTSGGGGSTTPVTPQIFNTSGGDATYNLPKASDVDGDLYYVFNSGFGSGNNVNVGLVDAGDSINGDSGDTITSGDARFYYADGTNNIWLAK